MTDAGCPAFRQSTAALPGFSCCRIRTTRRPGSERTYNLKVFGYDNGDDYLLNDTLMVSIVNSEIEESVTIFPNPFNEPEHYNKSKNRKEDQVMLSNVPAFRFYSADEDL